MNLDTTVIRQILKNWGIDEDTEITQIYKSAWDIGNKYVLKTGGSIGELEKSIQITKMLRDKNIPVANYVSTIDNKPFVVIENNYFCMMNKVWGVHIDPYSGDYRSTAYKLGKIVGRLHLAFKDFSDSIECYDSDFCREIDGWVADEIKNKCVQINNGIVDECIKLKELYYKLPRQAIHRDMHLGNMLFEGENLSGLIDFDLSQKNARVFDVCYLTLSILAGNHTNEEKCKQWYEIYENIFKGYDELCHLTAEEKQAVPYMFLCIELLFTAFFLKIGQVEFSKSAQDMLNWLYENRESLKLKQVI